MAGDGARCLMVVKVGSASTFIPQDKIDYEADIEFGKGQMVAQGSLSFTIIRPLAFDLPAWQRYNDSNASILVVKQKSCPIRIQKHLRLTFCLALIQHLKKKLRLIGGDVSKAAVQ
jgi:hypothetical protein